MTFGLIRLILPLAQTTTLAVSRPKSHAARRLPKPPLPRMTTCLTQPVDLANNTTSWIHHGTSLDTQLVSKAHHAQVTIQVPTS